MIQKMYIQRERKQEGQRDGGGETESERRREETWVKEYWSYWCFGGHFCKFEIISKLKVKKAGSWHIHSKCRFTNWIPPWPSSGFGDPVMGWPCLGLHFSSSPRAGGGTPLVPVVVSPYRRGHDSNVTDRHQGALPPRGHSPGAERGRRAAAGSRAWGGRAGAGGQAAVLAPRARVAARTF